MLNGWYPIFTKGRVVKKESIEYLRDFPHDFIETTLSNYSDGILYGFDISFAENSDGERKVMVTKGAVKFQENVLVFSECMVPVNDHEKLQYLKLHIGEKHCTEDYACRTIEIVLDTNSPKQNEFELGRFALNYGAILRCDYDSFSDMVTPENTLDITNVPYAGIGDATLHPRVMKEFARGLLQKSSDPVDVCFCLMCMNSHIVYKDSILWFVSKRDKSDYENCTLSQLYSKLEGILAWQTDRTGNKQKLRRPVIS